MIKITHHYFMSKITHYYFSSTIGIVRVFCEYDGAKYYLKKVSGRDINQDIKMVADWGNKFPVEAGETLLNKGYMTKVYNRNSNENLKSFKRSKTESKN